MSLWKWCMQFVLFWNFVTFHSGMSFMINPLVNLKRLSHFHHYCTIFQNCGVWTEGFNLPLQHFLIHYMALIRAFGAPNGLCSSITESKHIKAVKQPWWQSNCYTALGQMLLTNEQLDKIATCHADFTSCGMLNAPSPGKSLYIWIHPGRLLTSSSSYNLGEDDDGAYVARPSILAEVVLAKVPSK